LTGYSQGMIKVR